MNNLIFSFKKQQDCGFMTCWGCPFEDFCYAPNNTEIKPRCRKNLSCGKPETRNNLNPKPKTQPNEE
jgi:hypothetical protein